jgi:hypothetical protein
MDGKLFKTTYQQRKRILKDMKINKNKTCKKIKKQKRPTMQKRNKSQNENPEPLMH